MAMLAGSTMATTVKIDIDCASPTVELAPHMYGLFFEDINYAADGGLYAELVQNRSFEYYKIKNALMPPLFAWEKIENDGAACEISVDNAVPLNEKNTNYLKVDILQAGLAGVANSGFDGVPLTEGAGYDVSIYSRQVDWDGDGRLTISLELEDGTVCGKVEFGDLGKDWKKNEGVITSDKTVDNARLVITTRGKGELHLDMVSLFPQDTFMGRKNGMRKDLAQALKELNPKFVRFPGGCIAHGDGLENVYRWKDTIGDVAERKPNWNRWGYHQTYGLGYFEYFQLCEDLGATALPVIPVGVSCGFTPPQECVPMGELGPWIDDALDLIEFANGPIDTEWGGLRAKMGHPEPFGLKFVCLGNEPHDNALFRDRFPPFVEALREKHPEIKIIGTSGLGPEIPIYDLMTEQKVYSSDEHYYMSPTWFLDNTDRFDHFDRGKPLVFVGEYAAHDSLREKGQRVNTLVSAVAEAAFLTGIERNADIVDMTCYAPLFGRRDHSQWSPDLIYFDHRDVIKTANYYVQQLFACNKGDVYLSTTQNEVINKQQQSTLSGAIGVGSWLTAFEVEDVKVNGRKVDTSIWKPNGGSFEIDNGRIVQLDTKAEAAICVGSKEFSGRTVTYTLRARKTDGREGFLIQFGTRDGQSDYWWNLGGWGNSRHALQKGKGRDRIEITPHTSGSIELGKWYDIKIVMAPGNIKCYLDEKLIHDHDITAPAISVASTLDKAADEVIVKLVNPREKSVKAEISLKNVTQIAAKGTLMRISGERNAANTFEHPDRVKTETSTIGVGQSFSYTMPPMSVQFIRVGLK